MQTKSTLDILLLIIIQLKTIYGDSDVYKVLKDSDFPEMLDGNLIGVFNITTKINCFRKCSLSKSCAFVTFKENRCSLYKRLAFNLKIPSLNAIYCRNFCGSVAGLINYWPIYNSLLSDLIESKDLYEPVNAGFTSDRFGNNGAAIALNKGHYKVPQGVYFNGDFTVTSWVKVKQVIGFSRLFDFGSTSGSAVLIFLTDNTSDGRPGVDVFSYTDLSTFSKFLKPVELNKWFHIAAVLKGENLSIYFNGVFQQATHSVIPTGIVRDKSFIGKSNMNNPDANADTDDFKIFNRALSIKEIIEDFCD
ncbi:unnamed protein product [Brachionus calyciflorus]|uniref:Uncharacterized protein n=1 Tax=Brachionus calyciflorus TaxID=104777 RepID=A0A813MT24_9BILA|nr:unnamed protein product [Brachionus calyciflorus]